jgi:hypothetical protein
MSKPKRRELKDVDVSFVSLVKRGANRAPFKIMKHDTGDKPMGIDLAKFLFSKSAKAPLVAAVAAIIVGKTDRGAAMLQPLKDAGFNLETPVEFDDKTVYPQLADRLVKSDDGSHALNAKNAESFLLPNDVIFVVENVAKMEYGFESEKFNEMVATQGLWNSLYGATEALRATVNVALEGAPSKADAVNLIKQAATDYGAYVASLITALPEAVLKFDMSVNKVPVVDAKKAEAEVTKPAEEPKVEDKPKDESAAEVTKTEDVKPEDKKDAPADKPADAPAAEVAKEDPVLKALNALTETVTASVAKIDSLQSELKALQATVNDRGTATDAAIKAVEGVAKTAEKSVSELSKAAGLKIPVLDASQPVVVDKKDEPNVPSRVLKVLNFDSAMDDPKILQGDDASKRRA